MSKFFLISAFTTSILLSGVSCPVLAMQLEDGSEQNKSLPINAAQYEKLALIAQVNNETGKSLRALMTKAVQDGHVTKKTIKLISQMTYGLSSILSKPIISL